MNPLNVWLKNNGVSNSSRMWGVLSPAIGEGQWVDSEKPRLMFSLDPCVQSLSDADIELELWPLPKDATTSVEGPVGGDETAAQIKD